MGVGGVMFLSLCLFKFKKNENISFVKRFEFIEKKLFIIIDEEYRIVRGL